MDTTMSTGNGKRAGEGLPPLMILLLAVAPAAAQQSARENVAILGARATGEATFVVARDGGTIPMPPLAGGADRPMEFLRAYGVLFGVDDPAQELVLDAQRTGADALGQVHTTYRQVHRGIPVFTGMLKVHENAAGGIIAANGDFYPIPNKLRTDPSVTADLAAALAKADVSDDVPGAVTAVESSELVIVDPGWYGDKPRGARLAWYLVLEDLPAGVRDSFLIDAHSGEVLDRWSLLESARLRLTYNGKQRVALPGELVRLETQGPVDLPAIQESLERDINRAHDYAADVYGFFYRGFGYDSIDGLGLPIVQTVNTAALACPNAAWLGEQAVYCLGMASDDVVAHELMHGITQFTAALVYQNQPGQLNESFSDIFGELIDLYNGDAAFKNTVSGTPWPKDAGYADNDVDEPNLARADVCVNNPVSQGVRWLMGEDTGFLGNNAIRDMWHPPCFGDPDRANSPLQTCGGIGGADNGGVHTGSGIPNHAFAIMVDGKSFNGYNIGSMGPIKAGAVWFRALTTYLTPGSDFEDTYNGLVQSATDLIGTFPNDPRTGLPSSSMFSEVDAGRVNGALLAVEMNTEGSCGATQPLLDPAPPVLCPSKAIIFRDTFDDGVMDWGTYNTEPPTPYDWVVRDDLPIGREGYALYIADPNLGNCVDVDESARHELWSPPITLPATGMVNPGVVFTHFVATEPGYDGGTIRLRVNGGDFLLIPPEKLSYNTYNADLIAQAAGNTNPLAGLPAFTGAGTAWAQTVIDLTGLVSDGDTIRLRFDFGKDGCTGVDGWYIDDFEVFHCGGCSTSAACNDADPCAVDYCMADALCQSAALPICNAELLTDPFSGSIDARQPYDKTSPGAVQTWADLDLYLLEGDEFPADMASISEIGGDGVPPTVTGAARVDATRIRFSLSEPIEPGTWVDVSLNGVAAHACFASLPGDVNGSRTANAFDLIALLDQINGVAEALPDFATDLNRSALTDANDVITLIELLSGDGFESWQGRAIPPSPCGP
ncbi:MAG: M4 family metallopeptidase [Phycisphaerae bacterium]|nr:M4 family metallopeptidase [Phycisphaerae bacterium]